MSALAACLLLVAGCSSSATGQAGANKPLRVGMELAYPPFETKDASGAPSGISVDLAKALGEELKRPVMIENIAWDGLIPSLQSGKVDVVISSVAITSRRSDVVAFSDPYAKSYLAFLVGGSSSAKSVDELNKPGRTIAVKKGTTGEIYVRDKMPSVSVTALSSENAAVAEVVQGKADAFVYDQLTVYRQAEQNGGQARMMPIPGQEPDSWGIAMKKGDPELLNQVNSFLKKYRADGGFVKLSEKHLAKEKQVFDAQGFRWFFE